MNTDFASAQVFTNMQGLAELKLAAKNRDKGSLDEAARQFESLFLQMMLKTMREANVKSELTGSDQMQFHQEMFDQQLALELGKKQVLGIAEMLIRQLGQTEELSPDNTPFNEMVPVRPDTINVTRRQDRVESDSPEEFTSPEEFIRYMRPLAEKVAARLGVNAEVLIAQSALETGWGRKIIRHSDGTSSHNLFGIKARRDWTGPSATVNTLEYVDGTMQKTRDSFRMYESFAESFDDYAEFLTSNPRYRDAVSVSGDSDKFVRALQTAGYATDPDYADKIISIIDRHSI